MIVGIGSDIVEVKRIQNSIEVYADRFINRIFTETEQQYCNAFHGTEALHYAARFAYKEAFSKAIGTGISNGFHFRDCGVRNLDSGQPVADLTGSLKERYGSLIIHVTLSHTTDYAMAVVVIEK